MGHGLNWTGENGVQGSNTRRLDMLAGFMDDTVSNGYGCTYMGHVVGSSLMWILS